MPASGTPSLAIGNTYIEGELASIPSDLHVRRPDNPINCKRTGGFQITLSLPRDWRETAVAGLEMLTLNHSSPNPSTPHRHGHIKTV